MHRHRQHRQGGRCASHRGRTGSGRAGTMKGTARTGNTSCAGPMRQRDTDPSKVALLSPRTTLCSIQAVARGSGTNAGSGRSRYHWDALCCARGPLAFAPLQPGPGGLSPPPGPARPSKVIPGTSDCKTLKSCSVCSMVLILPRRSRTALRDFPKYATEHRHRGLLPRGSHSDLPCRLGA